MAERILMNEFKALQKEKWVTVELKEENIFNWNIALIVLNPDSLYYGGYFRAVMNFPSNYPYSPPGFKFVPPLYHPNIYEDGQLCISILHKPGDDELSGETAAERWSPAQRVESVLISILSLLDDAEVSSPANVDAGVLLRQDPEKYRARVQEDVETSKKDIPEDFVMPTHESTKQAEKLDDNDFWIDSDGGEDYDDDMFGGSDSDGDMNTDDHDTGSEEEDEDKA